MGETLHSVGIDVGTSTTQLILSRLTVENRANAYAVPDFTIGDREILYRSPIHFTPLRSATELDAAGIRQIVAEEYRLAGIQPQRVSTGAIIITGETARKENARAVLDSLKEFAGEFVVATAGPDLESVLAAKGAGAERFSAQTGKTVLHMDIGGGPQRRTWRRWWSVWFRPWRLRQGCGRERFPPTCSPIGAFPCRRGRSPCPSLAVWRI